ncbi:hypothetical protein RFI_25508, partial [Reticulomyxa filosa]
DKQQKVQQIKKQNQQAEIKLSTAVTAMKKQQQLAKTAARRVKPTEDGQQWSRTRKMSEVLFESKQDKKKHKKGWMSKVTKKLGGDSKEGVEKEVSQYLKAQQENDAYKACVMAANHEHDVCRQTLASCKKDCSDIEIDRVAFGFQQMNQLLEQHKLLLFSDKILSVQSQIEKCLGALNANKEFDHFVKCTYACNIYIYTHILFCSESGLLAQWNRIDAKGREKKSTKFVFEPADFQNSFYSLKDAIDITRVYLFVYLFG